LYEAQQTHATELVFGIASEGEYIWIKHKIEGQWYEYAGIPSRARPDVVDALARLAELPVGQFPIDVVLDVKCRIKDIASISDNAVNLAHRNVRLRWTVKMTSADAECLLIPVCD